jgi:succinoglycan biosynthesis transport protein ExoP
MDETEFDLRSMAGLLRRQMRLIILTVVAVVGVAIIIAYSLTSVYSSAALVMVDPRTKDLLDPEATFASSSADSARIDSEVEILRSDSILLRVIASENLVQDPEFGPSIGWRAQLLGLLRLATPQLPTGQDALNDTLAQLRSAVTIQRRGTTYLMSVQARSTDPNKAAQIANAITAAYINAQLDAKISSILASRDILQSRVNQARQAIVTAESTFDQFIDQNIERIASDPANADLASMQRQIEALGAAREQSTEQLATAQQSLESADWQALVTSLQSDALNELERQRQELTAAIADNATDEVAAVNLREQLSSIENNLKESASAGVNALQNSINQNLEQEESLRQSLRQDVLTSALSADVLTELYSMQQSSELARSQYQTLLTRVQDLDAQADLQVADTRIVSPALAPQSPSFPDRSLIVLLAGILGLGLGITLAFLYENLIGGFTSEDQVEAVLKTRVAAAIPRQSGKAPSGSLADLVVTDPLSLFSEGIRRIRVSIARPDMQAMAGEESRTDLSRVIMVCSTAPNEGKTTTALALARSFALSGQSTIIIDCDLRKPSLQRHLGIENDHGLNDFLENATPKQVDLSAIMSRDPQTDLTAILGARRSTVPTDQLLGSRPFAKLIEAARRTFDIIVLDTPPVGPVVDAIYLAPLADSVVFVTKWGSTSQVDAKRALASLREAAGENVDFVSVLNQQSESRSTYYRKYGSYLSQAY